MPAPLEIYPVLPLRDVVMFPKMVLPLFVGRESSIKALESASMSGNKIILVAQKDPNQDHPKQGEIFRIGVVSKILQVLRLQNANLKILVEGLEKVKLTKITEQNGFLQSSVTVIAEEIIGKEDELVILQRSAREQFEEYVKLNKRINTEVLSTLSKLSDPLAFCDTISAHLMLPVDKKQEVLEINNDVKKLERLISLIAYEIEFFKADKRIKTKVRTQIEKNQKDYYLNEQLKAIHKELGDEEDEISRLSERISKSKLSKEAKQKVESELRKLKTLNSASSEANVIRNYIEWFLDLPWKKYTTCKNSLKYAQEILDEEHYGLTKVKERIIEFLAVSMRSQANSKGSIICLVGPPGVGKTSLARSIAHATGRAFVKVSLGGLRDETEIKGHRRTYVAAMPGKIIQAMKKAKTSNPVILLDEIEKMGYDFRGDPSSALLEVLDPEQNRVYSDHYLEVEYDLSKVLFVATANTLNMQRPLLDRLEVIRVSSYTDDEKAQIAMKYLVPKQLVEHGLKFEEVKISDGCVRDIIHYYTRESGVRDLDRSIAKIMRKVVTQLLLSKVDHIEISSANLSSFLGVRKFTFGEIEKKNSIGVAVGLAYTEVGGDLLEIESVVLHGKGHVKSTGKLGDVMKESAQTALSYIRSIAPSIGISPEIFKEKDIHVHVPEGAIPKDGPSAGIAICTSIVSALTGIPVNRTVALTGEITLRGNVLPIGGLKEKLLAALRGGVKTVIIPKDNVKDLEDIPQNVKDVLEIKPVEIVDEVLKIVLTKKPKPLVPEKSVCVEKKSQKILAKAH